MDHVNNIPTGLLVPAQVPLDAKRVVLTNTILQDLGANNHLAFTYEDGLIVFSVTSRQRWEWRKRRTPEGDSSLLFTDFVYPDGHVIAGIDYSLKSYNFFLKREAFLLSNIGTGSPVYKGFNVVNEKHEFYTLKTDDKLKLSYPSNDPGVLLFTFPIFDNFSDGITPIGTPIYSGYNSINNKFQFYTLDSTDITIKLNQTTGIISLSLPQTSSVPTIYISQDYIPTYDDWFKANRLAPGNGGIPVAGYQYKGEGTLAKPFTNTVTYTLYSPTSLPVTTTIKTSIQNGIDYYVGTGSRLNPQRVGQKIQILSAAQAYDYDGDFSYANINLEIYGYVVSNTTGKLVDMDDPAHFISWSTINPPNVSTTVRIYLDESAVLEIKGLGFWNSGYDIPTSNYTYSKILYLYGKGVIMSNQNDISKYIINSGINPSAPILPTITYNNAGFLTFEVTCQVNSGGTNGGQGIVQNGGLSKVEFREGAIISSGWLTTSTDINLEAIKITGGWIRIFDSIISLQGTNQSFLDRERGITLNKSGSIDSQQGPLIYMVNTTLRGHAKKWFDRKGNCGSVIMSNCSSVNFSGVDLITSSGNLTVWGGSAVSTQGYVSLKNNTFDSINIDTEKIDLTIGGNYSTSNFIGSNIVQSLKVFRCKQTAALPPFNLPVGATFIKRTYINDRNLLSKFKVGDSFKIAAQSAILTNFIPMDSGDATITNIVGDHISYNGDFNDVPAFTQASGVMLHYDEICTIS